MAELKVITQKIENKKHELIGEVRGDIDVNMNNLNFQVNIFDKDKGSDEKGELKTSISDFFYNYFKPALKGTSWDFLVLDPLSMVGVDNITIKIGDNFDKTEGIIAISAIDGDISKNISIKGDVDINKIGEYNLEYSVSDSIGNSITVIRTVTVRTNIPPVINGINPVTIKIGQTINLLEGVSAEDTEDGNLTDKIKIAGTVNNQLEGVYNVIYEVTDSDGNLVSNTRVITVEKDTIVSNNTETSNDVKEEVVDNTENSTNVEESKSEDKTE